MKLVKKKMAKIVPAQRLYLIRHAKSSWEDPRLDDFDRPLSKRGKKNGPEMARRLSAKGICPDLIVSSPARRARKTAAFMAEGTGYKKKKILYDKGLYFGALPYHLQLIASLFKDAGVLFLVGHNYTITELAEYLTGSSFGNVPTCGIVAVEYSTNFGFTSEAGGGRLLFFDFPKNIPDNTVGR